MEENGQPHAKLNSIAWQPFENHDVPICSQLAQERCQLYKRWSGPDKEASAPKEFWQSVANHNRLLYVTQSARDCSRLPLPLIPSLSAMSPDADGFR